MIKSFILSIIVSILLAVTVIGALIEYKFLVK